MKVKRLGIKSHGYEPTSHKNIFRFVDRAGNWTHYWIKNKKLFVPSVNHIIRAGYPKGERFYQYLLYANPVEAERRLQSAGEEGSRTHAAIRDLVAGKKITLRSQYYNELSERFDTLNVEEWRNLEAFVAWCDIYKPEVLYQEIAVWSQEFNFAGTVDFIGTILIPDKDKNFPVEFWSTRVLVLLDWKTSSAIWDEYELQVAAYRKAFMEFMPKSLIPTGYDALWTGIIRLGTNHRQGFEVKVWTPEESETNFTLFASAYAIFVRKYGLKFTYEEKSIPAEFEIKIPEVKNSQSVTVRLKTKKKSKPLSV